MSRHQTEKLKEIALAVKENFILQDLLPSPLYFLQLHIFSHSGPPIPRKGCLITAHSLPVRNALQDSLISPLLSQALHRPVPPLLFWPFYNTNHTAKIAQRASSPSAALLSHAVQAWSSLVLPFHQSYCNALSWASFGIPPSFLWHHSPLQGSAPSHPRPVPPSPKPPVSWDTNWPTCLSFPLTQIPSLGCFEHSKFSLATSDFLPQLFQSNIFHLLASCQHLLPHHAWLLCSCLGATE